MSEPGEKKKHGAPVGGWGRRTEVCGVCGVTVREGVGRVKGKIHEVVCDRCWDKANEEVSTDV